MKNIEYRAYIKQELFYEYSGVNKKIFQGRTSGQIFGGAKKKIAKKRSIFFITLLITLLMNVYAKNII